MYVKSIAESGDKMLVATQMSHNPQFYLRIVGRYDNSVRAARYECLADLLAAFSADRDVLEIGF